MSKQEYQRIDHVAIFSSKELSKILGMIPLPDEYGSKSEGTISIFTDLSFLKSDKYIEAFLHYIRESVEIYSEHNLYVMSEVLECLKWLKNFIPDRDNKKRLRNVTRILNDGINFTELGSFLRSIYTYKTKIFNVDEDSEKNLNQILEEFLYFWNPNKDERLNMFLDNLEDGYFSYEVFQGFFFLGLASDYFESPIDGMKNEANMFIFQLFKEDFIERLLVIGEVLNTLDSQENIRIRAFSTNSSFITKILEMIKECRNDPNAFFWTNSGNLRRYFKKRLITIRIKVGKAVSKVNELKIIKQLRIYKKEVLTSTIILSCSAINNYLGYIFQNPTPQTIFLGLCFYIVDFTTKRKEMGENEEDEPEEIEVELNHHLFDQMGLKRLDMLKENKIHTIRDLGNADGHNVEKFAKVSKKIAEEWIQKANSILKK